MKKDINIIMNVVFLIVALLISLSFNSYDVYAAGDEGCCVLGNNAQYCIDGASQDECNTKDYNFFSDKSCSSIDICGLGTCVESDGVCSSEKSKVECQQDPKAQWDPRPPSQLDMCQQGCCELLDNNQVVLASQVPYQAQCNILADEQRLTPNFYQGECRVVPEATGCCEINNGCQETTQRQCTGNFRTESCSELNNICICIDGASQGCKDGDVYSFNSCGEATKLVNDCELNREICVEEFGSATCKSVQCDVTILDTTLTYDTAHIKSGNVGVQQKSGDDFRQVSANGKNLVNLKNSERACIQYQGPGEGHYVYTCSLGKLQGADLGDRRETICLFNNTLNKVVTKDNQYEQCLDCADGANLDEIPIVSWFNKLTEAAGLGLLDPSWWDYYVTGPGLCDKSSTCEAQGDCVQADANYCVPKYPVDSGVLCTAFSDSESGSPYAIGDDLEIGCRSAGSCDISQSKKLNLAGSVFVCTGQTILGKLTSIAVDSVGKGLIDELTGEDVDSKIEGQKKATERHEADKTGFVNQLRNGGNQIKDMATDFLSIFNPRKLIRLGGGLPGVDTFFGSLLSNTQDYFNYYPESYGKFDHYIDEQEGDFGPPTGEKSLDQIEDVYLADVGGLDGVNLEVVGTSEGTTNLVSSVDEDFSIALDVDYGHFGPSAPLIYLHVPTNELKNLKDYLDKQVTSVHYYGALYYPLIVDDTQSNWDKTKSSLREMYSFDNILDSLVGAFKQAGSRIFLSSIIDLITEDEVDLNKLDPKYWVRWTMCWTAQSVGVPHGVCMKSEYLLPFSACFLSSALSQSNDIVVGSCTFRDWRDPGYDECYLCNQDSSRECNQERCTGLGQGCEYDNGICKVKKEILENCVTTKNDPMTVTSGIKNYNAGWENAFFDLNITTSKFSECRITNNPDEEYDKRTRFRDSDDAGLRHATQVYIGDPSNNVYNYYVTCKYECNVELPEFTTPFNNKITITREPKPDLEPPEIIDFFPGAFQLLESRNDVTVWVQADEDITCNYGQVNLTADLDGSLALFADVAQGIGDDPVALGDYLGDNTPFGALGNPKLPMTCNGDKCEFTDNSVVPGEEYFYNVICEDNKGNKGKSKLIYFRVSTDFTVNILKPKDGLVTSQRVSDIEVSTERNTECKYSIDEKLKYSEMGLFQNTGGSSHDTQLPTPLRTKGEPYLLYVSCVDFEGLNLATDLSTFTVEPDITSPRLTRIFGGTNLKIETDEPTNCTYSEISFEDEEQIEMTNDINGETEGFSTGHSLRISDSNVYYVTCLDRDGNKGKYTIYP